jgi:hypothetical protein
MELIRVLLMTIMKSQKSGGRGIGYCDVVLVADGFLFVCLLSPIEIR